MNPENKSKRPSLFDSISNTTSRVSDLIKRIRGYEEQIDEISESRTENLGKALSDGEFQAVENDEVEEQIRKLQDELDQREQ